MLTELRATNYKSYGGRTSLPLKRLTVFLGKNNSGKTAAIRIPLLLSVGFGARDLPGRTVLPLNVRGLRYGASVLDLIRGHSAHGTMALGVSVTPEKEVLDVNVSVQSRLSLDSGVSCFVSSFDCNRLPQKITWNPEGTSEESISYSEDIDGFRGLLPQFNDERSTIIEGIKVHFENISAGLTHLTSMRIPTLPLYEQRSSSHEPSPNGSEVPFLINENPALLDEVSSWYGKNMDAKGIVLSSEAAAFQLSLATNSGGSENLAEVGQGMQQVLPAVTYLCALRQELFGIRTLVIEEPELHLHPSAHGAVADLMVDSINDSRRGQILVETHSENLILRLRRHVATGVLSPEDVNLIYFENIDGESRAREIKISADGSVSSWPKGVFAEDLEEVRQISKAARR